MGTLVASIGASPFLWTGKEVHEYDYNGIIDNLAVDLQARHAVLNVGLHDLFPSLMPAQVGYYNFEGSTYQYSATALASLISQANLLKNRGLTLTLVITLARGGVSDFYYPGVGMADDLDGSKRHYCPKQRIG